jgi:hypothetical protein
MPETKPMLDPIVRRPAACSGAEKFAGKLLRGSNRGAWVRVALAAWLLTPLVSGAPLGAQEPLAASPFSPQPRISRHTLAPSQEQVSGKARALPPRALAAQRFLSARGVAAGHRALARSLSVSSRTASAFSLLSAGTTVKAQVTPGTASGSGTWTALGPTAVSTSNFGLVTGRITSIAIDSSENVYIGTTGGGVWSSSNAETATVSNIVFYPLTDSLTALGGAQDASISIGALTVQPGGTGVVLAGTGDPNDVLDSYYGAGILRSTDGGTTWSLIAKSSDLETSQGPADFSFAGEGFAGFAWSTASPQTVVAAVTNSYEGDVADADLPAQNCEGLYYSNDSGATWHLATIKDSTGAVVQSASTPLLGPNGNAATAVVWNPKRNLFVAAIRFHGYYTSPDGMTWTRLADADQPGGGLNSTLCLTNTGIAGDEGCPIFRGALAVNPTNGDTFAWTVDIDDQDQGLWQDVCSLSSSSGKCTNGSIAFGTQWSTTALETSTTEGSTTIADGYYNLMLAAVPSTTSSTGSLVLAGAHDLWKATCPLSAGTVCAWRNTTNATVGFCSGVGAYQHALAWDATNEDIFIGNDSGLWRSTDGIAESGTQCNATDAAHFQNLNGSLGSLAEVESLATVPGTPYALLAGLGVNGAAGVKATGVTADWPQILSGYGGPVAIDPTTGTNWYVNDQAGVAIYLCSQAVACTPSAFGTAPVVSEADVDNDGDTMPVPAAFLVDPVNTDDLLVATCRVWRGEAGASWTSTNAISPVLDNGSSSGPCSGDALIRSMAAMKLGSGSEVIYLGMYGTATNGSLLPGHVWSGVYNPSTGTATWTDLSQNTVANDTHAFNYYGLDISSIVIDSHDTTGNTIYVTVEGVPNHAQAIDIVYRSTNGGATWSTIGSNLPQAAASSLAVDPQSANTVYIATDIGVYATTEVANCAQAGADCWFALGTGLPAAPVVELSAATAGASDQVLVAATYGRGIWQTPLLTANTALSAASAIPNWLTFSSQAVNTTSSALMVTVLNTGTTALAPTSIAFTGDFSESGDTCVNQSIAVGSSCTISVVFTPLATGPLTGEMTVYANVYGGQITVDLNGAGTVSSSQVTLSPGAIDFGQIADNTVTLAESVTVQNSGAAVSISSLTVTSPFIIPANGNACGTTSLAASSDCAIQVEFAPTSTGIFTGLLTLTDAEGTHTVELTGTSLSPPTDVLNTTSLSFAATPEGQSSAAQLVTITNVGGMALTGISISVSGPFQATPNCTATLAVDAVCTINVVFVPTQLGALTGTLTITDELRTQTVSLSGTGVAAPYFEVSPTSFTFTNQQPGVASSPQMLTITNGGASSMANIGFAFTGTAAAEYSISSTTCGAVLSAGAYCTAEVVFTPSATGAIAATLTVSSSTPDVASVPVALNGSGQLANGLTASPASLAFSVVAVGQSSSAQMVTVTNSTSYAIGSVSVAISGPFSVSQNGCTGSLAAGASCTVYIVFTPTAGGAAGGTLTVSSSVVTTPATVSLSGTGFDFTVAFLGPSSQTVAAGQTAQYTLVITPSGASGTFTYVCGTLPENALCLFNPTTLTLGAGVQGDLKVDLSTSSASASLARPDPGRSDPGRPDSPRPGLWRAVPLACGLLLLPLAIYRRRRIFQLVLLLAVLVSGVSSCTGSGGGNGNCSGSSCGQKGGGGTPAGTYTIPVTVSSTGISQTVDLVLIVD